MPITQIVQKRSDAARFKKHGSAICAKVTKWQVAHPEINCRVRQREQLIMVEFKNRRRLSITDLQVKEILAFVYSLVKSFDLNIERRLDGTESGLIKIIDFELA